MKKTFEEPKHEIIRLSNTDIIAVSGEVEPTNPSGGSGIGDFFNEIINGNK